MNIKATQPSLLLIICLIGFPQISETLYSPALPDITRSLMTSAQLVQWTLSVYFIGFALGVFYWGRLSDIIGRRLAMLIGLLIYSIGSLSCLFAHSIEWLLFSRVIQAFGASSGSVLTQTILREAFEDKERFKLFNIIGIALSFSPAIGPFLGGYINEWFGWRANFLFLVLMGILLLIYSFYSLPETRQIAQQTYRTLAVAKLLAKDKRIWGCMWLIAAINGILFSYYAEAPFIFIKLIGITPSQYGWLGFFLAGATLLGSALSHRLSHFWKTERIIQLGCVVTLCSALILTFVAFSGIISSQQKIISILLIMLPAAGISLGNFGLIIPGILSTALSKFKPMLGKAGAIFGLSYYIVVAILTWIMGIIHTGTIIPMPVYFLVLSFSLIVVYNFLVKNKIEKN